MFRMSTLPAAFLDIEQSLGGLEYRESRCLGPLCGVLSALFTDDWYAWQGSNLRPVAPEATALSI